MVHCEKRAHDRFRAAGEDLGSPGIALDLGDARQFPDDAGCERCDRSDPTSRGIALDLRRRAACDDSAVIEEHDAVGKRIGLLDVVSGQHHRAAVIDDAADLSPQPTPGLDVKSRGGFVQEQKVGVSAQGEGQVQALLLSAAQLAVEPVLQSVEARGGDDGFAGKRGRIVAAEQVHVFADAKRGRHAGDLQHRTDALPASPPGRIVAEDAERPVVRPERAEQQSDGGGLAGTVRAQHGDRFADVDVETEVAQRRDRAVALGDVGEGCRDGRVSHGRQRVVHMPSMIFPGRFGAPRTLVSTWRYTCHDGARPTAAAIMV